MNRTLLYFPLKLTFSRLIPFVWKTQLFILLQPSDITADSLD